MHHGFAQISAGACSHSGLPVFTRFLLQLAHVCTVPALAYVFSHDSHSSLCVFMRSLLQLAHVCMIPALAFASQMCVCVFLP